MENVLYRSVILPANKSKDGESPTEIVVTQEVNVILVWLCGYDEGTKIVYSNTYNRDSAIEFAVDKAREMRAALKEPEAA